MMNRSSYNDAAVKRLKWGLLLFAIILLIAIVYFFVLYNNIERSKTAGFDKTKEFVLNNTELTEIAAISRFQAENAYDIAFGNTKEQERFIVFVPLEKNKDEDDFTIINETKITSKQTIEQQWKDNCKDCILINIVPAMIDNEPLWEITYKDASDRYIFDYVSMYDGSQYEQLQFKRMFN